MRNGKKKKDNIIKLDSDLTFEEAMQQLANTKASEVDELMADKEIREEDCEPPEEC